MDRKKKNLILIFVIGFASGLLGLPLLSTLGVPSFDVVLTALFGEGSIWALVFSIMLIFLVTFSVCKVIKRTT